jgi:hypothetical protein
MNANRNIWQFICAAIVLIAVQFAPAMARAHTDQAHRHVPVHNAAFHGTIAADAPVAHSSAEAVFAKTPFTKTPFTKTPFTKTAFAETIATVPHQLLLTVGQTRGSTPIDSDGSVNGCCGAGMGCCGAAALAAAAQCLHPAVHSHRLDFIGVVLASGIEPASLRKPPRPLA